MGRYSRNDIQKAVEDASTAGLSDYMYQDPGQQNRHRTSRRRRSHVRLSCHCTVRRTSRNTSRRGNYRNNGDVLGTSRENTSRRRTSRRTNFCCTSRRDHSRRNNDVLGTYTRNTSRCTGCHCHCCCCNSRNRNTRRYTSDRRNDVLGTSRRNQSNRGFRTKNKEWRDGNMWSQTLTSEN